MVYVVKQYIKFPRKTLMDPTIKVCKNQKDADEYIKILRGNLNVTGEFYVDILEKLEFTTRS